MRPQVYDPSRLLGQMAPTDTEPHPHYHGIFDSQYELDYENMSQTALEGYPRQMAFIYGKAFRKLNLMEPLLEAVRRDVAVGNVLADELGLNMEPRTVGIRSVDEGEAAKDSIPAVVQDEHTDYDPTISKLLWRNLICPAGAVAPCEDVGSVVVLRPYSHMPAVEHYCSGSNYDSWVQGLPEYHVRIELGDVLIFRGDLFHRGYQYLHENRRLHLYLDMPHRCGGTAPPGNTFPVDKGKTFYRLQMPMM